jgi:hypothetical protein
MQIFNAYVNRSVCGHLHWDLFHEGTMLSSICQTVGLALLFAEVIYQKKGPYPQETFSQTVC